MNLLLLAIIAVLAGPAFPQADLPLHTERFSDRVLFAWACDHMQMIRSVALSTARGVIVIEELQAGFRPTFPTVLFEKSLILDMGDMTVELYAVGGTHTPSDIMIFVPEEGLVAVGDTWPDQLLPYLRKEAPWDLELILENWGRIVESGREIKHVNIAHSDMWLEVETFKQQYRYLKTIRDGLREMQAKGATLAEAKQKYAVVRDFPYFKDRMLKMRDVDIHQNNVEAIWERIGGK
jgi:glyoxylase-like metal-dependent hydrolase (beta-lactamase superfamily II)